jgi:hypothetical protein
MMRDSAVRPCVCGCGQPVALASTYRRGHSPASRLVGSRPKTAAHKAKLRENLLHGAARLGAIKAQLGALLQRDPADAYASSVLAEIGQLEMAGKDPMPVVAEHGDQIRHNYMKDVVQPMAPTLDDERQQELKDAKAARYGADWAAKLAARAGHGGKGKSKTPEHAAKILPNLLTEAKLRALHGGKNARNGRTQEIRNRERPEVAGLNVCDSQRDR